jgi:LytS/YehU family sensor histidine kinase
MRLVLENSKQNFIPLSTEIETLKRYLELEKMRFDNSFTFKISIDKNMLTNEINVPPMLIQPYLENAIWHGLAPKKSDGILVIDFENTADNYLKCSIEDNGIGRVNAAEIAKKRKNHTSTGLKNIEERLELINMITNSKTEVEIVDLYDENNNPIGTKVVIKIPYKAFV